MRPTVEPTGRFAVMAPYWLNGLHNTEGLALAEQVNQLVVESKLEEQEEKVAQLLLSFPAARQFGLGVVPKEQYLDDPWRKANPAQPINLLNEALVRDKDGAYRPAAGGRPVLWDKGDSLKFSGIRI